MESCAGSWHKISGERPLTAITLDQAERIIDAVIERGAALNCRPLSVIVVEPAAKRKPLRKKTGRR
jgi:uncharacterized protein GlcG (DUF336 family)